MVMRLYLDGCSYTFGLGLDANQTLEHLFVHNGGYTVTNKSRNGKSNLAIAMDAYANYKDHDIIVLGFTFSGRFYIKCHDCDIDFQPRFWQPYYGTEKQYSAALENEYKEFHKIFYSLYHRPFCDEHSDFLIDTLCFFLQSQGKKVIAFSWEKRNTNFDVFYPYIPSKYLLPNNHYNAEGTKLLYDMLNTRIDHACT